MKRLSIIILLAMVYITVKAYSFSEDGLYYDITSPSTVSVTRISFANESYAYGKVVIPPKVVHEDIEYTVTAIGSRAFCSQADLVIVVIPNTVTSIGPFAFEGCKKLSSVEIPNSVTSIGQFAFEGCENLSSVEIPNSVTSIGGFAFEGCEKLNSVYITDLEAWCKIDFDNYYIELNGCKLYLNDKELTELVIPESINIIKNYAFSGFSSITSVVIPNSVTSIGQAAFDRCKEITSVKIGASVASIGHDAFQLCEKLNSVYITDLEAWCKIDFVLEDANPLEINGGKLYLNDKELTNLIIPESIDIIKKQVFNRCKSITSVEIPNSVTSIGSFAFNNCKALTSVKIGASVTSIDAFAFSGCESLQSIYSLNNIPPKCGNSVFYHSRIEATLYVPQGNETMLLYQTLDPWKDFKDIKIIGEDITVVSVSLNYDKYGLMVDDSFQLKAQVEPEDATDKTIAWSSSDEKVATVSEEGVVTAVSAGTATITAACGEVKATCEVTVYEPGISIEFNKNVLSVSVGDAEEPITISLFSVFGQRILCQKTDADINVTEKIDLSKLTAGTYIVQVVSGEMTASQRIVKE